MITSKIFSPSIFLGAFLYGILIAPVQANELKPVTIKTIHIHLHGNAIGWESNLRWVNMLKGTCPVPYPKPPVPITVFKSPGNVISFEDSQIDIYWSGTHLAQYTTTTHYKLEKYPSCEWTTGPTIKTGEIDDYKTHTHISIDYLHKSLNSAYSQYVEPDPALRLKEDANYAARIRGTDTVAGKKCDVVIAEAYVSKQFPVVASNAVEMSNHQCVLSDLHRFPGTNNWINLKTYHVVPADDVPAESVNGRMHAEDIATVFEENAPIPADAFIPPNFPMMRLGK